MLSDLPSLKQSTICQNKKNGIEKTKALITRLEKFRTDSEAGMKNETNSYFSWSNNNRERTKHSIISK